MVKTVFTPYLHYSKDSGFVANPNCFAIGFVSKNPSMNPIQHYSRQSMSPKHLNLEKFVGS